MAELRPLEVEQFERLSSYPFSADREFAVGLSIILGHPELPASEAEINRSDDLTLQAKCFYFSRKEKLTPPLNFSDYKTWLGSAPAGAASLIKTAMQQSNPAGFSSTNHTGDIPKSSEEPAYPSSFAHIVELITTGQPIPGIQQIPDTVLTGHDTPSEKPKRRKPWEKEKGIEDQDI
ncbi:hypothetical protein BO94DRAFT_575429 [Aspergillus sclerotioniger CBS 115572]|uniref:Uncharacterized protein n=1 Tax=Aspergillus sclerotioniger CBS 115572 TaxID=1450535 RepID=A0A317WIN7_9EURO|nr:hypothetical protein BO94DRAFT_575429 [Aspergillus sclerotioniger CBS 115572]PWY86326.1 hypothetical protein BO94DRAFT_575429 [Aspergillus sclerotioniger CBS 115572]